MLLTEPLCSDLSSEAKCRQTAEVSCSVIDSTGSGGRQLFVIAGSVLDAGSDGRLILCSTSKIFI